jgi:hypothetical protein
MIYSRRRFQIHAAHDAEELAHKLTQQTWTLCTAFLLYEYVFLNDSFSEDAAQEYAVVKLGCGWPRIVESITFSWCKETRALELIRRVLLGEFDHAAIRFPNVLHLDAPR